MNKKINKIPASFEKISNITVNLGGKNNSQTFTLLCHCEQGKYYVIIKRKLEPKEDKQIMAEYRLYLDSSEIVPFPLNTGTHYSYGKTLSLNNLQRIETDEGV